MKINKLLILFFFVIVIFSNSCIEEYSVKVSKYDNSLIVDGMITNLPGPYEVKLSQTSALNAVEFTPVKNADVSISDNLGNSVNLFELEDGSYTTGTSDFTGIVGREYKIIIISDNNTYSTDFAKLQEPIEIKSMEAKVESRDIDVYPFKTYGYQIYLDSEDIVSDSTYLAWQLIETYKFYSNFPINYVFMNDSLIPYPNSMEFYTCWKTNEVSKIFVSDDIQQSNIKRVDQEPLYYIDNRTDKITVRYSLLVKQLSIDANTYLFLSRLEEQSSNEGSLYTTQPFQITGNVYNVDDMDDKVLGSFVVASVSEKRIFISRPSSVEFYYDKCEPYYYESLAELRDFKAPVYVSREDFGYATGDASCFDCRLKGGDINKPDFWID